MKVCVYVNLSEHKQTIHVMAHINYLYVCLFLYTELMCISIAKVCIWHKCFRLVCSDWNVFFFVTEMSRMPIGPRDYPFHGNVCMLHLFVTLVSLTEHLSPIWNARVVLLMLGSKLKRSGPILNARVQVHIFQSKFDHFDNYFVNKVKL